MEVKNYIKCRKSSAIYSYYMYVVHGREKGTGFLMTIILSSS